MAKQRIAHPRRGRNRKQDRYTKAQRLAKAAAQEARWVAAWETAAEHFVDEELVAEVNGVVQRPRHQWGDRQQSPVAAVACFACGPTRTGCLRRNGTYDRTLLVVGLVLQVRVPRLRCVCGRSADLSFSLFAPYQRISPAVEARLREYIALGLTLRQVGRVTAPQNGGPLAKSTINARVVPVAAATVTWRDAPLARCFPVVLLDGLWVKQLVPTGKLIIDRRGRVRPQMRREKVCLLVAYGVDPTTGTAEVLEWEQATGEEESTWARLLERLRQRGLTAERGLRLVVSDGSGGLDAALKLVDLGRGVVHQRCVFHKLRNVRDAVRGPAGQGAAARAARREVRRKVLAAATEVYAGADRAEIERRRVAFVARWRDTQPEAVATLERDFAATVVYLDVQATMAAQGVVWPTRYLRTTSALERLNRLLRTMTRTVVLFHSEDGLDARITLTLLHAGRLHRASGDDWRQMVELALTAA